MKKILDLRTLDTHCTASRKFLISLFLLTVSLPLQSRPQEHRLFTSNMLVEGRFDYGFLYAQHLELERFNSHLPLFEINIQQETYGKHKWERAFAYPIIGMSFLYTGLGKSPELGSAFSVFPFIDFPLVRHKRFMFNFRFGLGVGYLTKRFDRISNYKNLAIGSHLNASANMMLEARYKLAERVTVSLGIALQHFSNGSLKLPNYGINLPVASAGIAYRLARENRYIGDRYFPPTEPFSAVLKRTIEFDIGASIGWKNMTAVYGENFWVYHFFENTFFPVKKKSKWGFGLDLSYDQSHVKVLESNGFEVTNRLYILRPGINAAYQLVLGQLRFIFNLGYYLGGQEKSNGPLYEKLSFQYNFTKDFFANVMLKVHFGRADYIAWGVGLHLEKFYGKRTVK
jgi:hypothetical protein